MYLFFSASLGLPLVSPDVCPPPTVSQSSRSLLPCPSQQPQQPQPQAPPQTALLPTPQQHPMGNHMIAQVRTSIIGFYVVNIKDSANVSNSSYFHSLLLSSSNCLSFCIYIVSSMSALYCF